MKYYLIAGEASGDLHASRLMHALKQADSHADFRFFGGDAMTAEGGTRVKHIRELAYMGFVPVLLHLPTIFRNMALCKRDIVEWQPDVVILIDYPGFNLGIAKYVHTHTHIPVYYYISPKIWAWKEWRIKSIKQYVDKLFSILPFEVPFYEEKHHYKIDYVGNPTAEEVNTFRSAYHETREAFCQRHGLDAARPIVALLAGSRRQEIKDNLPGMLAACSRVQTNAQFVIAGAPSIDKDYYAPFTTGKNARIIFGQTYELLSHSTAALVTSGTATLETALFRVPQAVCYETPVPKLIRWGFNHVIKCKFISLVNLIADREVVPELLADRFTVANMQSWLTRIMPGGDAREAMLQGYDEVAQRLGSKIAPEETARIIVDTLRQRQ